MANMMQDGAAWLASKMFDHAASTATYQRGVDSVSLPVVRAETTAELNTEYGLNIDIRVADFMIRESDLVLASVLVKPERGDEIVIVVDNETVTYEVLPEASEDFYRESDRFGNVLRVHTKETGRV